MSHLLVTNDFPPKVGGIQSYLHELWRRLPAADTTVLTPRQDGAEEWDREQPFRIERVRESFLVPTPGLVDHINTLADEVDAGLVLLDPAWPLGTMSRCRPACPSCSSCCAPRCAGPSSSWPPAATPRTWVGRAPAGTCRR